ncbi:PIN domain-containing protein [Romboutsia sp.]|uniref:PIN domain-containing protein n=1 Tax=Romboutsia sp. TaxID=1965302 RepID=UPI003F30EDBF
MRFFLLDSENIQQYNFIDDLKLGSNDKIIMFVSDKSKNIKVEDLKRFTLCNAQIEFEDVCTGDRNALDFQLIAYLALIVATSNKDEDNSFYVVSNDKDFKVPCEYLKNKTGADISIFKTEINSRPLISLDEVASTIEEISDASHLEESLVLMMKKAKNLSVLHNQLKNTYGDDKGRSLYDKIKPLYKSGSF